ncbi:hypothetical protein KXW98_008494, partial [Aspergillus fumigatus]
MAGSIDGNWNCQLPTMAKEEWYACQSPANVGGTVPYYNVERRQWRTLAISENPSKEACPRGQ